MGNTKEGFHYYDVSSHNYFNFNWIFLPNKVIIDNVVARFCFLMIVLENFLMIVSVLFLVYINLEGFMWEIYASEPEKLMQVSSFLVA